MCLETEFAGVDSIVGGSCHKYHFCRDKSFVAATDMILVAAPASDSLGVRCVHMD